jgi:hypothetical protein
MVEGKKAELLLLDSAPLNTDELAEIFLLLVRALPAHLTPLDRFEHELPESFAFPPHRMLDAIAYAKFYSRSHDAVIRVFDETGNVIQTHEHAGEFREP